MILAKPRSVAPSSRKGVMTPLAQKREPSLRTCQRSSRPGRWRAPPHLPAGHAVAHVLGGEEEVRRPAEDLALLVAEQAFRPVAPGYGRPPRGRGRRWRSRRRSRRAGGTTRLPTPPGLPAGVRPSARSALGSVGVTGPVYQNPRATPNRGQPQLPTPFPPSRFPSIRNWGQRRGSGVSRDRTGGIRRLPGTGRCR